MHHVDVNADRRGKYVEHTRKYDISSLSFPVPLQTVGSFALSKNNDNEAIYPLPVYYCSNVMVYSTTPPLGTLAD